MVDLRALARRKASCAAQGVEVAISQVLSGR